MIKEAIDRIIQLRDEGCLKALTGEAPPYVVEAGRLKPLIKTGPESIKISTLTGIQYFLEAEKSLEGALFGVHIESPQTVTVLGTLQVNNHNQRWVYLEACATVSDYRFGHYYPINDFIVNLQTCFVPTDEIAMILKVVGNIKDGVTRTVADDGVTQSVNIKAGIERVSEARMPNPVTLKPYRTFTEIAQPGGQFVLRMIAGQGGALPSCALFEADGGLWKLQAMKDIHVYLSHSLPEGTPIIQ